MPVNSDLEELLRLLNRARVKYLIVGAHAVIFYTEPRYTKDVDIWIRPDPENAKKVYEVLRQFGAPVKNITLDDLTNPEMVYQIGVEPNRIDILMGLGKLSFDKAWGRKRQSHYGKERIYLLALEDIIRAKREAGRNQDKRDIKNLEAARRKQKK